MKLVETIFVLKGRSIMRLNKEDIYLRANGNYEKIKKSYSDTNIILLEKELFIHHLEYKDFYINEKKIEEHIEEMFSNNELLTHYEKIKVNNKKYLVLYSLTPYEKIKDILKVSKKVKVTPFQMYISEKIKVIKGKWDILIIEKENIIYITLRFKTFILYNLNISNYQISEIDIHIQKLKDIARNTFGLKEENLRIISNVNFSDISPNNKFCKYEKVVI